uniref:C-type lectin domain-containing protein n=1 Tax=Oryctolagus cuniculus TaxID=9986 RepID=A0A5F9DN16_RABIT
MATAAGSGPIQSQGLLPGFPGRCRGPRTWAITRSALDPGLPSCFGLPAALMMHLSSQPGTGWFSSKITPGGWGQGLCAAGSRGWAPDVQGLNACSLCSLLAVIIKIGSQTFMRFEDVLTWSSARHYCRQYHTDLANLQAVADGEDLKPITRETEAWIGLYYNASSSSTSWAGSQNDSMPRWMEVPMLSGGQCAGLRAFFSYAPRVSAMNCSSPQPFICFYGLSTSLTGAAPDPASTTRLPPPVSPGPTELCLGAPHLCSSAPQPQGVTPSDLPADSASPGSTSSVPEGVPGTPPTTAQGTALHLTVSDGTPVPGGGVTRWPSAASPSLGSTGQASATSGTAAPGGSSASSWSRGAETPGGSPGQEESVAASPRSGKPAVAQGTTAPPVSTAQSQAAARESNATAVVSTEDGTDVRPTAAGTRAQRLATSAWTRTETGGKAGHAFGILKADFVVSSLKNPEEMRDQFLSEIQAVLKRVLGHARFSLKWVGSEANGR